MRTSDMRASVVLFAFCVGVEEVSSFHINKNFGLKRVSQRIKAIKWDHMSSSRAPSEPSKGSKRSDNPIRELIARAGMDVPSMYQIFTVQGLLLNAVILSSLIFNIDVTYFATSSSIFDSEIWKLVLQFTGALLGSAALVNIIPLKPFVNMKREAQFTALERYGLTPPSSVALGVALVSTGAGIVEELAFRGLCFGFAQKVFGGGPLEALFFSSVLYALYHMWVYKTNAIIDSLFGTVYTLAFYLSGGNMIVPILIHTLYEFFASFFTWVAASTDLTNRIREEETKLDAEVRVGISGAAGEERQAVRGHDPDEASIRALFGLLDADKDGSIDEKEWSLGLRLFGLGPTASTKDTNYDMFYKLDQGRAEQAEADPGLKREIQYEEFASAMRDTLRTDSWPRREDNIPDW